MNDLTGMNAFERVLEKLLQCAAAEDDNRHLLAAVRLLKDEKAALSDRVGLLQATIDGDITRARQSEKPIADLYDEASHAAKVLAAGAPSKAVASNLASALKIRLKDAAPFATIPF